MRKTRQSLLTAALFAAAVSTSAGGAIPPQLASAEGDITTVPQTTYGPPVWMTEPEITTTELMPEGTVPIISSDTTTSTTPTAEILQPEGEMVLPGILPVFHEAGDLNMDGSIDVRDLTILKQFLLFQHDGVGFSSLVGDVNCDGIIDRGDVKALIRLLTGKPEEEDEPAETDAVTTTATTFTATTCPLYGPPPAWI